jgi:Uma2 family endonuclease
MTATTATTMPQLVLRSLDANWDYARWEQIPYDGNLYEVLDGVLYMTTSPSNYHGWISLRLVRYVGFPAEDSGLAYVFVAPNGLLIPGAQPAQPDFVLVRREKADIIHDKRIQGIPDLIAEILSPSNPELDTDTKLGIYARAGVPEYWIVRPATRDILVHWQPDRARGTYGQVSLIAPDARLVSPTLPIEFAVANLFTGAPDTAI